LTPNRLDNTLPQNDADLSPQPPLHPPATLGEGGHLVPRVGSWIPSERTKVELDLGFSVILPKVTDQINHANFPSQQRKGLCLEKCLFIRTGNRKNALSTAKLYQSISQPMGREFLRTAGSPFRVLSYSYGRLRGWEGTQRKTK